MIKIKEITLDINGQNVTILMDDKDELNRILVNLSYLDDTEDEDKDEDGMEYIQVPAYYEWLASYTNIYDPIPIKQNRGHESWVFDDFDLYNTKD